MTEIRLAIVGSRDYNNYDSFKIIVDKYISEIGKPIEIVSGGAKGVDSLAERYAQENNIPMRVFQADWQQYGKSAGPRRNTEIIENSTCVLALPAVNSVGTFDSITKAQILKKPLKIVHI